MEQIKERCIYCGSDVYYTGAELLIKCSMCGHTLIVAKFENELAKMNAALEEGEQAKKELAEAEKARQEAEVRLHEAIASLDDIQSGQDVLSLLIQSVIAVQDTAEGKLTQVKDITERVLKGQGDIIEGMAIFGEIKDKLQEIGLNEQAQKDFAKDFVNWFQDIHADDVARMEQLQDRTSSILAEQKEISDKIDSLHQVAEETKEKIDEFENRYTQDKLGELRQLYRQAQNYQFDRAYDKAYDKYEQIVIKGGGDAAVLWHMILCHYCVSYQENDEGEMIPIIMNPDLTDPDEMSLRLDFENLLNDQSQVTEEQAEVYRCELDKIDSILDEYRNVKNQENYDIFISVKQDEDGHFTNDSDTAANLYYYLISKGYKVFNSRITKIPAGEEYEPYIISALLSAKVMIVVGTSPENMNATWVKNEWSRFQWIQQSEKRSKGETDKLLLCYLAKPMQPKDIPRALNPNRQAIVEGVDSGDVMTEALEDVFRRRRFRQKPFLAAKKPSKLTGERIKAEKETRKPTETHVNSKEDKKLLKEDSGVKSVPSGSGEGDEGYKSADHTSLLPAGISGKWALGTVAAAILIIVFAVSRMGGGVHKSNIENEESNSAIGFIETDPAFSETESNVEISSNEENPSVIRNSETDSEAAKETETVKAETEAKEHVSETNETESEYDYAIDWKDENLEKAMREITGITDRDIMFSDVKEITELDLYERNISDISALGNLTNLTVLRLTFNKINDISALGNLTNLTVLKLYGNKISDISALGNLTNLTDLELGNKINDISVLGNLTNLTGLYVASTEISDITALRNLTSLRSLYLGSNKISDISALRNLTNLAYLYLNNNKISDISALRNLTNLIILSAGGNYISDISALGNLTNLTELWLCQNEISDISALGNLTNLTNLRLDSNKISDIGALSNLTKLESLFLSGNEITDYSPIENLNIKELYK